MMRSLQRARAAVGPVESSTVDGLVLTRLLATARLTPAQAVALGADVLACLEDRHAAVRAQVRPGAVRVGRDGRAHLLDAEHPPPMNGAGLGPAAALLDRLRAATRPSTADGGPIAALERAAAEARSPRGGLPIAAAILLEADAEAGAQARAELATLVAMLTGEVAGEVAPAAPARPAPAPTPRRGRRPRRPPRVVARAAVRHSWKWALSLVVLVAAVLIEIAFLRDEITRDVQAVLDAGRSAPTPTSAPAVAPVVPPAPAAAGTITRVELRPVVPCTPGADCALRVQVVLQPRAEPQTITWDVRVLDRCTGTQVSVPGGSVTVPPHGDRADVVRTVGLPPADVLAVLAVTSAPFTAASAAVPVPATGTCGS